MFSCNNYLSGLSLLGVLALASANRYESEVMNQAMVDGASHTIQVDDDFVICDVDIEVDIVRGNSSAVHIDLSFGGMTVDLANVELCSLNAIFDDSSTTTVDSVVGCVSYGTYQPQGSLSVFNSESSQGSWTLEFPSFSGFNILTQWAVILTPCEGAGTGDPHFKTWANKWYDFHGVCDLVFLSNPKFAQGTGLEIHIRTKARYQYSYIESAAIQLGEDILEVGAYGGYMLNGISNADLDKLDKYTITHQMVSSKQSVFIVELGEGKQIVIQSFKDLVSVKTVGASFEEYGGSMGLLGEFGTGQWLSRNGTVMSDADAFGNEWQVLETEPKLFQMERFPQHPVQCTMPSHGKVGRRLGESIAEAAAEKACEHWGDLKDQCVYDVMAAGDLELAEAGAF
ncbi:expressed unknown protein [Seminavis robusta]|uniref:VWFD domain-containing protein n=1 Tax=Seminavis robusta TaxID=568900 RepID=A0A9N8HMI1_9STRA|nr:expressed unknown protein [Seminavis robusta]|eukprot:Sro1002_g229881.1  (398) ;mRNA; f:25139-26332